MTGRRTSLSKKTRFAVFKRDAFACQYCGKTPPGVVLEVDHIVPVSGGGGNEAHNLITACFDCNRGKGAEGLSVIPESLERRAELMLEKHEQIKAYNRLILKISKAQYAAVTRVEDVFKRYFPGKAFTENFSESCKRNFVKNLPEDEIQLAMHTSCIKFPSDAERSIAYFCGICWRKIRGDNQR